MQEIVPLTFEFIGTILIGLAVLKVHTQVGKDHKIDKHVISLIRKERTWTITGLILILFGYLLNIFV